MNRNRSKEKLFAIACRQHTEKEYWLDQLKGSWKKSCFPFEEETVLHKSKTMEHIPFRIPDGEAVMLDSLCSGFEPAIQVYLLAVTGIVMSSYVQHENVVLGIPIYRQDKENLVNTCIPLRINVSGDSTFQELVMQVKNSLLASLKHQNYPIEVLAGDWISESGCGDDFPLFDVSVIFENLQPARYADYLPHNVSIHFTKTGNTLLGCIYYNSSRYNSDTIKDFIRHFSRLLQQALTQPTVETNSFAWLSHEERIKLASQKSIGKTRNVLVEQFEMPANAFEERLASIWMEVLDKRDHFFGRHTDFFKAGGHSLNAIQLCSRVAKAFNVKLSVMDVMEERTLQKIATLISARSKGDFLSILPASKKRFYQTTFAQQQIFALQVMQPNLVAYNMSQVYMLDDTVDMSRIKNCFRLLIDRHEVLRTTFKIIDGKLFQEMHDSVEFHVQEVKVEGLDEEAIQHRIRSFVQPFDLSACPLMRAMHIAGANGKNYLAIDIHHIISDAISHQVLGRDFSAIYLGETLPAPTIQYKDYAEWMNSPEWHLHRQQHEAYWLNQFALPPMPIDLPVDFTRPSIRNYEGKAWQFELRDAEKRALEHLAQQEGTTLHVVLLTIYFMFLAKISGQEDIIIGLPVSGRQHVDLETVIGLFINIILVRNYPSAEKSFRSLLQEVQITVMNGLEHQQFPLEELLRGKGHTKEKYSNPLYNVLFSFVAPDSSDTPEVSESLIRRIPFNNNFSKFDLILHGEVEEGRIVFVFEYSTQLFKEEKIQNFGTYLQQLVNQVIERPDKPLKDFIINTSLQFASITTESEEIEFDF